MENAEVLEETVKQVENILQNRAQGKYFSTKSFACASATV